MNEIMNTTSVSVAFAIRLNPP